MAENELFIAGSGWPKLHQSVKDCCEYFIKNPLIAKPFSWVFVKVSNQTVGDFHAPARTGRLEMT
jgi:hypothetical protein